MGSSNTTTSRTSGCYGGNVEVGAGPDGAGAAGVGVTGGAPFGPPEASGEDEGVPDGSAGTVYVDVAIGAGEPRIAGAAGAIG